MLIKIIKNKKPFWFPIRYRIMKCLGIKWITLITR